MRSRFDSIMLPLLVAAGVGLGLEAHHEEFNLVYFRNPPQRRIEIPKNPYMDVWLRRIVSAEALIAAYRVYRRNTLDD